MPWDHVQRLWTALVESPVLASDMCGFQLAVWEKPVTFAAGETLIRRAS